MKISFPSKEVYPNFTSVILHGPTVEWRRQGCKGVGAAGGAAPPREPWAPCPQPPRGIDTSFELVAMETANGAGRRRGFGMPGWCMGLRGSASLLARDSCPVKETTIYIFYYYLINRY